MSGQTVLNPRLNAEQLASLVEALTRSLVVDINNSLDEWERRHAYLGADVTSATVVAASTALLTTRMMMRGTPQFRKQLSQTLNELSAELKG